MSEVRVFLSPERKEVKGMQWIGVKTAVGLARCLSRLPPHRVRRSLEIVRKGARPATAAQTLAARETVVGVSLYCAGEACLPRSIAVVLVCRAYGVWPTWCTGARLEPFRAHAWVEAEGEPVGEGFGAGELYSKMLVVPPVADEV